MAAASAASRKGLSQEEQEKYFNDANENVRKHAFYMQQSLDQENLHDALRHASQMINELRTSKLFPTRYYEVYMNVTNQLTHLQGYVEDEYNKKYQNDQNKANQWLKDLYDRVQYCGNIVPRLYLLITVGAVCIKVNKTEHAKVMEILFDLVSLSKGVQHATRGLFLRNYLSQVSRLLLPDVPEGVLVSNLDDHPIIKKSVEFVLQNFAEMTRLWVRMQHQGAVRDRARRERERLQLRMLVGTNLRRLSALSAISKDVFKNYALKQITDQVTKCKDKIAQEYLMECIIMVFSDEYHLATLDDFLEAVNKLQPSVNVNAIIIKLMERLAKFAELLPENKALFEERNVFQIFQEYCKKIIEKHKKMSLDDVLSLQVELVNFAAQCYPGKDECIVVMIKEATEHIRMVTKDSADNKLPSSSVQHVHRMLVSPLTAMNLKVLDIEEYCELINYMPTVSDVRNSSADIVEALVTQNGIEIENASQIQRLFAMIQPLLHDANAENDGKVEEIKDEYDDSDDQFEREQYLVAKIIHLINNENTDQHYKTLHTARKYFGKGGEKRLLHTFPPLVYNCLKLIQTTFKKLESMESEASEQEQDVGVITVKPKKMFQFVHQICSAYGQHAPELGVRLWLQCGLEADKCGYSDICYEFLSQAFLCYEEHVSDSNEQYEAIRCIISYLQQIETLDEENYDTLRSKTTQHSNRLLKKPAAAKCYCLAAHLFIDTKFQNHKQACKLLNKACKRVSSMMDALEMTEIFVEVLNKYVYLLVNKATDVEVEKVNGLIQLIEEKIKESSNSTEEAGRLKDIKTFFRLTCQYISDLKQSGDKETAAAFAGISV